MRTSLALLLLLLVCSGCRQSPAEAKISGQLVLEGQPLDNCLLTFLPEATTTLAAASAVTNSQGHYELLTNDEFRRGIPVGDYRITIQDLSVTTGVMRRDRGAIEEQLPAQPPQPPRRSRLPLSYADAANTKLRITATQGAQTHNINLPKTGGN